MSFFLLLAAIVLAQFEIFEPLGIVLIVHVAQDILEWKRSLRSLNVTSSDRRHGFLLVCLDILSGIPLGIVLLSMRWLKHQAWALEHAEIIGWYLAVFAFIAGLHMVSAASAILRLRQVKVYMGPILFSPVTLRTANQIRLFGLFYMGMGAFLGLILLGYIGLAS